MPNRIEDKAFNWLINSLGYPRKSIRQSIIGNPDFETPDGIGWEVKTCQGSKYFHHRRNQAGTILFSSVKQWETLYHHPDCRLLIFGEGKEPIYIIPMSELPIGAKVWRDIKIRVIKRASSGDVITKALRIATENQNAEDSLNGD